MSVGVYNTKEEIDYFIKSIDEVKYFKIMTEEKNLKDFLPNKNASYFNKFE